MEVKVLYTAHATSLGGRTGHTQSDDGLVSVDLTIPKEMGGPGKAGATTPEDLFAAGYAACFGSACDFVARQQKLRPTSIEIRAAVGIGQTSDGGFRLTVQLEGLIGGVSEAEAEQLVTVAHSVCPYSRAVHGNVDVQVQAKAV